MTIEDDVRATSAAMVQALTSNDASLVAGFLTEDWVHVAATGVTRPPRYCRSGFG